MRLDHLPGRPHLTYCTNIHAGETWAAIRSSLAEHLPEIKSRVCAQGVLGVGLRLSGIAAEELIKPAVLAEFKDFLAAENLYVFTINAFPYGPFHGTRVKEEVYQPDWLTRERLDFSNRAAEILSALLPADCVGSMSTVPGTFKPIGRRPGVAQAIANNIARHAATLVRIHGETGHDIALALEPEPCCFIETVEEAVTFFRDHLHSTESAAIVADLTGLGRAAAADALRRHVGLCYDVCHGAVEFEEPAEALRTLADAGIRVAKVQLSSALRVAEVGDRTEELLRRFDDGVYLHQVVEKRDGRIIRYVDLAPAFAALRAGEAGGEWRVHCHVPIFLEQAGALQSTQKTLEAALDCIRRDCVSPHLEVETYTWDVLPADLRAESRASAIARELGWVLRELGR
jgi:sugar phosphate isomerase/epimerase